MLRLNSQGRQLDDNGAVRRAAFLAGVWSVGVVVAVAVAFAAVGRVANGVAPHDVARLSASAIDQELAAHKARTAGSSPRSSVSSSTVSTSSSSTTPTTSSHTTPTTIGTTQPTAAPDTNTTITAEAPPPTASPTTQPSRPGPTTTVTSSPPDTSHNTVTTSQGGTVFTRCSGPDSIVYVAAVPKTGYERTTDVESASGIRQTFENGSHRSSIEAECSDGVVHAQVDEESIVDN